MCHLCPVGGQHPPPFEPLPAAAELMQLLAPPAAARLGERESFLRSGRTTQTASVRRDNLPSPRRLASEDGRIRMPYNPEEFAALKLRRLANEVSGAQSALIEERPNAWRTCSTDDLGAA